MYKDVYIDKKRQKCQMSNGQYKKVFLNFKLTTQELICDVTVVTVS